MSLRLKILISFMLCIVLTFSPLLYIMQTKVKDFNMKQLEHETLQLLNSKSNEIGAWLNHRIGEIRIIHEHPACKKMDFSQLKPYLAQLNLVFGDQYGTFALGGLDGIGWLSTDATIDVSERKYFKKAMTENMEYVISKPVVSKSDSKPIFLICYPILNDNEEKVGFINGSVNLDKISEIVHNIDIHNGFAWIMNKNTDIYSTNKEKLNSEYISLNELNKIVKESKTNNSGSVAIKNIHNKNSTVFFSSVPYTEDWLLCIMLENSQIHEQTNKIINLIIWVGIILLLAATLLAIIISGSIVKPIHRLKNNMLEVSDGNLESYYEIKNNDEISILGQVFNKMLTDIKRLIDRVYQVEKQKRSAELRVLQSQINPHFLYNTLDTIQWKALEYDAFEVADMINYLSGFFRISLSDGKEFITISDELEHVKNYLEIQKIRYKDKISYSINVCNSVEQYLVPKLIVQPLVENSIYHGLKLQQQKGMINVSVFSEHGFLFIKVLDNGLGMNNEKLIALRKNLSESIETDHYGLYNINERLKLAFGEKYSIEIKSKFKIGTEVLLKIPLISERFECLE
ncbi:cache domain-containing sensor histidine kinase [Clostridium cochlearium]|uniref:cache domain-containing sensor histidine kinase n=1 Tax=Clostridium cochlearium TaxID=1494 RepID=UPI001C0F1B8F|nr:sensor histidine kinase [Clostridium cochlearium]MBU5270289.1 sensor histidine kinase [Clostridium cochlearium]